MKKGFITICAATCLIAMHPAIAARHNPSEAISAPNESRIVRYTYSPEIIFRIYSLPTTHTHIELGEDEGLKETPVAGDTVQWRISGGPRNLYVKPVRDGIQTSLTVVTNKRTYQFQLISSKKEKKLYQKVSFDYPDRAAEIRLMQDIATAKINAEKARLDDQIISEVRPEQLDFNFDIDGDTSFKPTAAYTDGTFTYLRLPNTQDCPVVFLIDENDKPSLINYRVKANMIMVERLAKKLLLKLGDKETTVKYTGNLQ